MESTATQEAKMRAVCLHQNNFGQYCEKPTGHTGNHRARMFSVSDAQQAFERQLHIGDPRWRWVGNGWLTNDRELVNEAMQKLARSKRSGHHHGGYPAELFAK
jgi:hypothetical protein